MIYKIGIGNNTYDVEVGEINAGVARVTVNGNPYEVLIKNYNELLPSMGSLQQTPAAAAVVAAPQVTTKSTTPKNTPVFPATQKPAVASAIPAPDVQAEAGAVVAPIPGLILEVKVKAGDIVTAGQTVATMEAMKMENNIVTNVSGTVKEIRAQKGSEVATGDVIMVIG